MQQGPECRVSGVVYIVVFSAIGLEQTILLEVLDLVPSNICGLVSSLTTIFSSAPIQSPHISSCNRVVWL